MIYQKPTKDWRKTICIDFDGVIAKYNGWKGPSSFGKPIKGAKEFLKVIKGAGFKIVIFTLRPINKIREWLKKYNFIKPDLITSSKVPALVYVDDRGLKFDGCFDSLLNNLKSYRTHWEVKLPNSQSLIL